MYNAQPAASGVRADMKVFSSSDNGETWALAREVYPGPAAYSSLAQLTGGRVVLAYERDLAGCDGESCSIEWRFCGDAIRSSSSWVMHTVVDSVQCQPFIRQAVF